MTTHKVDQALAQGAYRSLATLLQFKGMTLGAAQLFVDVIDMSIENNFRTGNEIRGNSSSSSRPTLELAWTQRRNDVFPDTDLRLRSKNGTLRDNLDWPAGHFSVREEVDIETIFPTLESWERDLVGAYLPHIIEIGRYLRCLNKSARLVEEIQQMGSSVQ